MQESTSSTSDEFVCDLCGEKFETVTALEAHKRQHSDPLAQDMASQREIRGDIGAAGLPTSPVR